MNENENINNFRSGYAMWVGSRQQQNFSLYFALSPSHTGKKAFSFVRGREREKENLHKNANFPPFYCRE